ncbi:MAG: serine--tRNA ligase [Candidatus Paceibacterota bacterium]|jgi:seryl-tRNA synthetase
MLDINLIRQNPEKVKKGIASKNVDPKLVDDFLVVDEKWRNQKQLIDEKRSQQKNFGKDNLEEAKKLKIEIKDLEVRVNELEKEREVILYQLPNIPTDDVPIGKDASENVVIKQVGEKPKFDFVPQDYLTVAEKLDLIDIERASKVSGSRFGYIKGGLALLEFALIQFVLSALVDQEKLKEIIKANNLNISSRPFIPIVPPVFIKPDVFQKMARLEPKEERYYIPSDDLYLVGSAEHTLGSMHLDETFKEDQLPLRYIGFSTSFRREAGSYGQDTKGILRVHQFDKLEMESFTVPEDSIKEQDFLVAIESYIVEALKLPFQVVKICTGDMGGPDTRQIDIETWMPGQNKYRETHTSDLMTDYQARRLNTRVKRQDGKIEFVHMNDATALAVGRILIAIIENYQTKDGTIKVPEALQKYIGIDEIK